MSAIKDFFRQYHAVPATDIGPSWNRAGDDALMGWAGADCQTWEASPAARPNLLHRLVDMCVELDRRANRHLDAGDAATYSRMFARLCTIAFLIGGERLKGLLTAKRS